MCGCAGICSFLISDSCCVSSFGLCLPLSAHGWMFVWRYVKMFAWACLRVPVQMKPFKSNYFAWSKMVICMPVLSCALWHREHARLFKCLGIIYMAAGQEMGTDWQKCRTNLLIAKTRTYSDASTQHSFAVWCLIFSVAFLSNHIKSLLHMMPDPSN